MLQAFFQQANWLAILVTAIAFFVLGSLWFSLLFGKTWQKEVEKIGITIRDPKGGEIAVKMLQTFGANALAALSMAILVFITGTSGAMHGFKLGLLCAAGFSLTSIFTASVWESRSFRLIAIDAGYPFLGILACGIILSVWK
jgi:hypothetical protein